MAYKIVVTKRFTNKLLAVLTYLEKEWGQVAAANFLNNVDAHLEALKHHPYIGSPSHKIKDVRGLYITKHNRLFYKIEDDTVVILNLYDTRKGQ